MDGQIARCWPVAGRAIRAGSTEPPDRHGTLTTELGGLVSTGRLASVPGSYEMFYRAMAAAVRGDGPVPVPPEQARDVIGVIECAMTSSREGRVVAF